MEDRISNVKIKTIINIDGILAFHHPEYEEGVDSEILLVSALLHDIARVKEDKDTTGSIDHAILGAKMAGNILRELDYPDEEIEKVIPVALSHEKRKSRSYLKYAAVAVIALSLGGIMTSNYYLGKNIIKNCSKNSILQKLN